MKALGNEVLPLTNFYVPNMLDFENDSSISFKIMAAVISEATNLVAIGYSRKFVIDPLLQYGSGDPLWYWQVPWTGTEADFAAQLKQVDNELNRTGHCGPDDRSACFVTNLCLAWRDIQIPVLEGRMVGQFSQLYSGRKYSDSLTPGFAEYFVPGGETVSVALLGDDLVGREEYGFSGQLREFRRLCLVE